MPFYKKSLLFISIGILLFMEIRVYIYSSNEEENW